MKKMFYLVIGFFWGTWQYLLILSVLAIIYIESTDGNQFKEIKNNESEFRIIGINKSSDSTYYFDITTLPKNKLWFRVQTDLTEIDKRIFKLNKTITLQFIINENEYGKEEWKFPYIIIKGDKLKFERL